MLTLLWLVSREKIQIKIPSTVKEAFLPLCGERRKSKTTDKKFL